MLMEKTAAIDYANACRSLDPPMPWDKISERIGVTRETVKAWVNPEYAEERRQKIRDRRARDRGEEPVVHGAHGRKAANEWTKEEDDLLHKLFVREDYSASYCARKIGRSRSAVIGRAFRKGWRNSRSADPNAQQQSTPAQGRTTEGCLYEEARVPSLPKVSVLDKANEEFATTPGAVSLPKSTDGKTRLLDLTQHTCRWPIGDPRDADFHFCGAKPQEGSSYCSEHHAEAYTGVPPRKKARAA